MDDWNDLKYVLAVVREGSTLAASRVLKQSQSTVMRRIAALEEELGYALFEKTRSGYQPTDSLTGLLPKLEAVEAAHLAFDREAALMARGLSGTVRMTASELLAVHLLARPMAEFRKLYPDIKIELITTDAFLDLATGEADIAVRAGERPTDNALFGRRIMAMDSWSLYCSKAYAQERGVPKQVDDFKHHAFIALVTDRPFGPLTEWLKVNVPESCIAFRQNSLSGIYANMQAGMGISVCPDILAGRDPDLIRCFPIDVETGREIWLLAHERHRKSPHVRVVLDFFANQAAGLIRSGQQKIADRDPD